jgi:uncharacterized protein (DUF1800 family)
LAAAPLTQVQAAHLMRRAAFGGTLAEINALVGLSRDAAATKLLGWTNGDTGGDMAPAAIAKLNDPTSLWWEERYVPLQNWWYDRMATDPFPLREKLTLFWHGHFCSELRKVAHFGRMQEQMQLFRKYAKGDFIQFVKDVSHQPTMLGYLDNETSKKGFPNLNFGREFMELFTLGVGNYTEPDIRAMANAWTGYSVDYSVTPAKEKFVAVDHETADKTFFGDTANYDASGNNGVNIIDRLFAGNRPQRLASAKFIARKMFEYFAYEGPSQVTVDTLAAVFVTNFSIEALVRRILVSDSFFSAASIQGRLRSPVEWYVAAMRTIGLSAVSDPSYSQPYTAHPETYNIPLGQELLNPPNVAGWKLNSYWVSTSSFWARGSAAQHFAYSAEYCSKHGIPPWLPIIENFVPPGSPSPPSTATADQVAQAAFESAGLISVAPTTRAAVIKCLTTLQSKTMDQWYVRTGLAQALLLSPDFQMA